MKQRIVNVFSAIALLASLAVLGYMLPTSKSAAQQGGVTTIVGATQAINQFAPTTATGQAGSVTNPSSNFVVQVQAGPIYYGGNEQFLAQSQMTLPASSTNLIVWNGLREQLYAKQAVTGPGSNGTSAINGPGNPATLLFADPNQGEIALATVVCNATACGNGGNGTITDNRTTTNFPSGGVPLGTVAFANLPALPDGTVLIVTSATQPVSGSATCTSGAATVLAARVGGAWRCY